MKFEVEQKFPISDPQRVERQLREMDASFAETVTQVDRYFNHPARDFAETDEAVRIRQVGPRNYVTYKGPKLDARTKTRLEIELPLHDGMDQADQWDALLQVLGFRPVAEVRKRRHCATLTWQNVTVEIAMDHVEHLGDFVELELVVDAGEQSVAQARILSLADELQLSGAERRSYLELLLNKR